MRTEEIKALTKSIGKYFLPNEIVSDYRKELKNINKSVVIITLDSCRYDVFKEAYDEQLPAKKVRKAYSPCNWTLPSHESIARGFIPFGDFADPLETINYNFGLPLPEQHQYSFGTTAIPYLSQSKTLQNNLHTYFDNYYCAEKANSCEEVLSKAEEFINNNEKFFGLINLGETHSPYKDFENKTTSELIKNIKSGDRTYSEVYEWQVASTEYLLEEISTFTEKLPKETLIIVTSDHGELFGENESFGHNPHEEATFHKKLYEVPLIYWTKR